MHGTLAGMHSEALRIVAPPAKTDTGRARTVNQDTGLTLTFEHGGEGWTLLLVADGVGGGVKGDVASATAARIAGELLTGGGWTDPAAALQDLAVAANAEIWKLANEGEFPAVIATTLVVALIRHADRAFWTLNVGDSRAYVVSGDGVQQLSEDHSVVAERVRRGELSAGQAREASGRNVITRAVGAEPEVAPDIEAWPPLNAGDVLLLCSDGLSGVVPDEEIAAVVRAANGPSEAGSRLIARANDAGGPDNITVALAAIVAEDDVAAASLAASEALPGSKGNSLKVFIVCTIGVVLFGLGMAGLLWISGGWSGGDEDPAPTPTVSSP